MGAPVRFQKAVPRTKENAAVERREARRSAYRQFPPAGGRRAARSGHGCGVPHQRLSALRSLTSVGSFPSHEGGNAGAPRALREQGRRSFGVLSAGCLKCESEIRARKWRRAFWRNEPEAFALAPDLETRAVR